MDANPDSLRDLMERYANGENDVFEPLYRAMAPNPQKSLAFQAARALVFEGVKQPNGYTEPLLHQFRARVKAG